MNAVTASCHFHLRTHDEADEEDEANNDDEADYEDEVDDEDDADDEDGEDNKSQKSYHTQWRSKVNRLMRSPPSIKTHSGEKFNMY